MPDWVIEGLTDAHDRSGFSCGKPSLDDFLKRSAGQYERKNVGRTFVALSPGSATVAGYYTLAAASVACAHFPPSKGRKKLPPHPIPVAHLGRLAVDQSAQGKGLCARLLLDALRRVLESSQKIAVYAVDVRAIDDDARAFYLKCGFLPLEDDPLHLFLPIETVRQVLAGGN